MTIALVRFELVPDWERSPAGEEYSHEDVAVIACDAQDRVDLHTPFNSMCNTALAANRDISVYDGYGNARIHHFDQDGKLPNSWDEVGIGPVQSHLPHGIALDSRGIFMPPRCPAVRWQPRAQAARGHANPQIRKFARVSDLSGSPCVPDEGSLRCPAGQSRDPGLAAFAGARF